jgi:hypothetical protein
MFSLPEFRGPLCPYHTPESFVVGANYKTRLVCAFKTAGGAEKTGMTPGGRNEDFGVRGGRDEKRRRVGIGLPVFETYVSPLHNMVMPLSLYLPVSFYIELYYEYLETDTKNK